MTDAIESALAGVAEAQIALDAAVEAAEGALTDQIEAQLKALAERFPKRKFEASSGMGSISIEISRDAKGEGSAFWWAWGARHSDSHNPVWNKLAKEWEALFDDFGKRAGLEYINFTRDITIKGRNYRGA